MWGNTAAGGFSRFWLAVNDSQGSSTGLIAMQAQSQGLYTAEYTVYQAGYQSVSAAVLLDDSQVRHSPWILPFQVFDSTGRAEWWSCRPCARAA